VAQLRALVRRVIPPAWLRRAGQAYYLPLELRDRMLGRYDPLVPPRWLHFVGGGDFVAMGRNFLRHFIELAGLRPAEDVLDIGCGVGRMARPLTGYLDQEGSYRGFDIVPEGIAWCRRHITPYYPHFQFQHANIYNAEYNRGGFLRAGEFIFPYPDNSFDFAFATSVFTHMLPVDVANYLAQIRRVLRPGGRCLLTFFILNDEAHALMAGSGSLFNFAYDAGGCFTTTPNRPEAALAYQEAELRILLTRAGLALREPLLYGSWCGREHYVEGQDMLLAYKE
jgi:SAM-dependent methyltransferase